MHAALVASKDVDPLIRASGLSHLGTLCKTLKFAVQKYIQEALLCISKTLQTDKDVQVRRAAIVTIFLLLEGMGYNVLFEAPQTVEIIKKQLEFGLSDPDPITQLHSSLALQIISEALDLFFQTPSPPSSLAIPLRPVPRLFAPRR